MRSTLPAKPDGGNLRGSWPAIWMLGTGNGHEWPRHGEIDIVEMVGSRASNEDYVSCPSFMTFASASQFHIYLSLVNACLA